MGHCLPAALLRRSCRRGPNSTRFLRRTSLLRSMARPDVLFLFLPFHDQMLAVIFRFRFAEDAPTTIALRQRESFLCDIAGSAIARRMRVDPAVATAGTPSPRIAASAGGRACLALLCRQERPHSRRG